MRWAHLVSDDSYDELHDFARRLGKRRLGFQGDHYDVDEHERNRALQLGAAPMESRELVRRLRSAGLRNRTDKPRWEQLARWDPGVALPILDRRLHVHLDALELDTRAARAALFADVRRLVLLLDLPPGLSVGGVVHDSVISGEPRPDGWRSVEIFVDR